MNINIIKIIIFMLLLFVPVQSTSKTIIKFNETKDALYYYGTIESNLVKAAIIKYKEHPYKVLVLGSYGGDADAGMLMAAFVQKYNIAVFVPKMCASACTFPFFAARYRDVGTNAIIALHNTSAIAITKDECISVDEVIKLYREAADLSANIVILYLSAGLPISVVQESMGLNGNNSVNLNRDFLIKYDLIMK